MDWKLQGLCESSKLIIFGDIKDINKTWYVLYDINGMISVFS